MPHRKTPTQTGIIQMNDRVTDVVAVSAVTSFYWLPDLATWSQFAAAVTPIIGLIWLIFQILSKAVEWYARYLEWKIKRRQYQHTKTSMIRQESIEKELHDAKRAQVDRIRQKVSGDEGDTWP